MTLGRILVCLEMVGLAACGGGDDARAISLAVIAPLSGDLAAGGREMEDSMHLAVEEINAGGGVRGHLLALDIHDDGSTGQGAAEVYTQLLAARTPVILGPSHSAGVVATAAAIRDGKTLTLTSAATSPALTTLDDGGYLYRAVASDSVQAIVLAQRVLDRVGTHVCVVFRNDAYGSGLAEALRGRLAGSRLTVVESSYDPASPSLETALDPCEAARAEASSGLVLITFQADGRLIFDDAAARGWRTPAHPIFLVDGNRRAQLFEALADVAAFEGATGTAPSGPPADSAAGQRRGGFRDRFIARYARPPGGFGDHHYDTVYLAAIAMEIARSTSDRAAIHAAIARTSTGRAAAAGDWAGVRAAIGDAGQVDYLGASGEVNLDAASGDLLPPFYIQLWTIGAGAIVEQEVVTVPP